ncbi:hypothetical protein DFR24_4115 [Panacagrimonas perspica]|uniref:Uncharacterized protein n=1 Tax=Panacagrimonas perspica TaxID=381431 RepID=A0A4R7NYR0_9GAMM|nr:hypothetical protein [Panacagrimonas perspica]TDU25670.1 hypothetical protein DFR24_4115 [Panacagrimonas perspica]
MRVLVKTLLAVALLLAALMLVFFGWLCVIANIGIAIGLISVLYFPLFTLSSPL